MAVTENKRKEQEETSSSLWMSDVLFEQLSQRVSSVMDYITIVVDVASTHTVLLYVCQRDLISVQCATNSQQCVNKAVDQ